MDNLIGKKLDGRYQLVELIGIGGMSNVYRAQDLKENKIVAVKVLKDEFAGNLEFLRHFKNESKAIAMLSHKNIVKIFDVSFFEKTKYIVMEYIDGISLKDYIDQQGVIKWKEAVFFTVQLLNALSHAHSHGIVHRDIKPQNVMLLPDGTIKITDFGIARLARNEARTITDKAIGSVHYISPEQASGMQTDERSDIYSLGVMLFEMLTGKLPFEADSPVSVALKQIQVKPPRPTEFNSSIPEGLESIVMKSLEKDPNKRYQNAEEMMKDIAIFKQNPSIKFSYKYNIDDDNYSENKSEDNNKKMKSDNKKQSDQKNKQSNSKVKSKVPFVAVLSGITAAFVVFTVIFVGVMFIIKKPFHGTENITMPKLIGQDYKSVVSSKEYKNFDIEVLESKYNAEYAEGQIIYQNPPAGRTVKEGADVKIKISKGAKMVSLPNFSRRSAYSTFDEIKKLDLSYEEFPVYSETIPKGNVVKTEPSSGTSVMAGSNVIVYVSQGPLEKTTRVPDVTNMTLEQAKEELKKYNLFVGEVTEVDSELEKDKVVEQTPGFAEKVDMNTKVDLKISTGIEPSDEDEITIGIRVWLPSIDRDVNLEAYVDKKLVDEATLNPYDKESWTPTLQGSKTKDVKITIDGEIYQVFTVDFENRTADLIKDYSEKFSK